MTDPRTEAQMTAKLMKLAEPLLEQMPYECEERFVPTVEGMLLGALQEAGINLVTKVVMELNPAVIVDKFGGNPAAAARYILALKPELSLGEVLEMIKPHVAATDAYNHPCPMPMPGEPKTNFIIFH